MLFSSRTTNLCFLRLVQISISVHPHLFAHLRALKGVKKRVYELYMRPSLSLLAVFSWSSRAPFVFGHDSESSTESRPEFPLSVGHGTV